MAEPDAAAERIPVVDVCGIVLDADGWEAYLRRFARHAPHYLRVFWRTLATGAGADRDAVRAAIAADALDRVVDLLLAGGGLAVDVDAHVAALERDGIAVQAVHGFPLPLADGTTLNDRVAALTAPHRDRLEWWAGLSLDDPDPVAELERCVEQLGARGASVIPFFDAADLLGPAADRLFARLAELELPLWLHTGQHFAIERPLDVCSWRHVDAIAGRHPRLKLVVGHGGWPWVGPLVAVCQRHRNVYLDLSTHRGPHMRATGSGWEPVLLHGRGSIRRQIVFGSTSWAHGLTPRQLADELITPDLDPRTARAWLHDNALRALAPAVERNAS